MGIPNQINLETYHLIGCCSKPLKLNHEKKLLITFFLAMATGGCSFSLAGLKRKLDDLAKQIFEIDLKIQQFKQQNKDIADLQEAKRILQQDIVSTQIQFELQKAKNKKHN